MTRFTCSCLLLGLVFALTAAAPSKDDRYYEMRIYYAAPGKLEDLQARFRNHTTKIFEKHGMTNVGYWVPLENPDNRLVYILAYPSKEAREKSWKDFGADPAWQSVQKTSETNGKLVDRVESIFMRRTDYSPKIAPATGKTPRVFQLRTYTATAGKLPNVHARFRDHTVKLFRKHGMTNVGYWEVIPKDNAEPNTLIYVLAHPSQEAGEASFNAFRADPNWTKAKTASEANGPIVDKVEAVYMAATDYSPVK
jgi:hypothetical protein